MHVWIPFFLFETGDIRNLVGVAGDFWVPTTTEEHPSVRGVRAGDLHSGFFLGVRKRKRQRNGGLKRMSGSASTNASANQDEKLERDRLLAFHRSISDLVSHYHGRM